MHRRRDRRQQVFRILRKQKDQRSGIGLLQGLQQPVLRPQGHGIGVIDDRDVASAARRSALQLFLQLSDDASFTDRSSGLTLHKDPHSCRDRSSCRRRTYRSPQPGSSGTARFDQIPGEPLFVDTAVSLYEIRVGQPAALDSSAYSVCQRGKGPVISQRHEIPLFSNSLSNALEMSARTASLSRAASMHTNRSG